MSRYFFIQYRFRHRTDLFIYYFSAFYKQDSWYRSNAIVNTQIRILIYIYLTYINAAVIFFGQLFR